MDSVGIISLADRVFQYYNQCNQASAAFNNLHSDLHSFHQALLVVEPYIPADSDLRRGCEEVVTDIGTVLSRHASLATTRRAFRQRIRLSSVDIGELRDRLSVQTSCLTLYLLAPIIQIHGGPPEPSRPTGSPNSIEERANNSQSPAITDGQSSVSVSTSSVASSETGYHSPFAIFKAKLKRPRSRFTKAAEGGDVTTLLSILNDRVQLSQLNPESINEALIAVSSNYKRKREQTEVVRHLLSQNAELEYRDGQFGFTPLIWAVSAGREDIVDVLLDNGALIEARDGLKDWTPLIWAVWCGHEVIIRRLIGRRACLNAKDRIFERTPLLWAAKKGTYGAAKILLQADGSSGLTEDKDKQQLTPLVLAYMEGHEPVAETLLNHGADPNSTFPSGMPLLISAVTMGFANFVRLLINKGATIQCKNGDGIPVLSVAVREEHPSIAKFLITKGASLEAKDGEGRTALVWAIARAREDLVEMLVKSGADRFAVDNNGRTARQWSELTNNPGIIELVSSEEG